MGSFQSKVVALQYAAPLRYAAPYSTPPLRSSSRSRQSCALSRAPSVKPTSSLRSLWRRADQHRNAVLPFLLSKSDFDDDTTRVMGEAFDAACKGLQDTGQPALVHEIIAKRIIESARKGERDPVRLVNAGLAALGYDREAI